MPPAAKPSVVLREKQNWLIHMQYARQEYAHLKRPWRWLPPLFHQLRCQRLPSGHILMPT